MVNKNNGPYTAAQEEYFGIGSRISLKTGRHQRDLRIKTTKRKKWRAFSYWFMSNLKQTCRVYERSEKISQSSPICVFDLVCMCVFLYGPSCTRIYTCS